MKKEEGKVSIKAIIIIVITVLTMAVVAIIVLAKTGIINGINISNNNEQSANSGGYTKEMTYVGEEGNNYVFIDTAGNLKKIGKDILGNKLEINEDSCVYNNNFLISKDGKQSIVDFSGKTVYGPASLSRLVQTENVSLYQVYEGGKYGVVNSEGKIIVPIECKNSISKFSSGDLEYFRTSDYNNNGKGYIITFFDKDGKKVYEDEYSYNYIKEEKSIVIRDDVAILSFRKDENTVIVLNLKDGKVVQTLNIDNNYSVSLDNKGGALEIQCTGYGDNKDKKIYCWFDNNDNVSKTIELAEDEYIEARGTGRGVEEYCILKKASEYTAIDKYGKEFYKTTNSLGQAQYTNEKDGTTISYLIESLDKRQYKVINSSGNVILDKEISTVGNNYVLCRDGTLYKHDGTKYIDGVVKYESFYDLDVITTKDRTIIENKNGNRIEKEKDYTLKEIQTYTGDNIRLICDNVVVFVNNKKVTIINTDNLSVKELDFSSASYVYARKGYIFIFKDSNYEYYNKDGNKIFTKSR